MNAALQMYNVARFDPKPLMRAAGLRSAPHGWGGMITESGASTLGSIQLVCRPFLAKSSAFLNAWNEQLRYAFERSSFS
jgi:hypothetical protein